MEITKRNINSQDNGKNKNFTPEQKKVGNYECETTKVAGIYKILSRKGG